MKTGILILTIGLLVACNHGGKHEIFDANGLTTGELKSCMLFTTYKDGILGGSASKPTTPNYGEDRKIGTEYNEALCWITHDGGRKLEKNENRRRECALFDAKREERVRMGLEELGEGRSFRTSRFPR